jgi:CubicO group peptidase (beta-lactamase class C family)
MRQMAIVLLLGVLCHSVAAQTPSSPPLSDYAGTYVDEPGRTLELVAGDQLFAVIDEAKYSLRRSGGDEFSNAIGQKILFRRDATGKVIAFEVEGKLHACLSPQVTAASVALARPRPVGEDSPDGYRYQVPADLRDGVAVGDIAQSDLGVATAEKIVRGLLDGTWKDVHSVLLYQRGHLVLEEYFYGYDRGRPHQLRSATKSIVSALTGVAIDRGALSGVNEPVLPHLSYATYENPDPRKAKITLRYFLTMSSGLACNDYDSASPGRETLIDEAPDWVKATLDLPMIDTPGTTTHYCSGGVAVVGRVTENAVHMLLPDFAQANLFGPLGIRRGEWRWNYTLTNANREYSQIHLRPRDMLKIGILFDNEGQWKGRQVLSSSWVKASLSAQSQLDGTGYGYFWWRPWLNVETPTGTQKIYVSAAQGNGGQKIYIVPEYDLIAVFTGGDYNSGGSPPNKIMAKIILPTLISVRTRKPASPLPH